MKLLKALYIYFTFKDKPLDVQFSGNSFYWNADEDKNWQEYRKAMDVIYKYKWLYNALNRYFY